MVMSKTLILYNPIAGGGRHGEDVKALAERFSDGQIKNMLEIGDYHELLCTLDPEDKVILCGGDGTVNRFINDMRGVKLPEKLYYYALGSGNDFLRDIEKRKDELVDLGEYLLSLPTVNVNGAELLFLNGVGYGIDGYCCAVGDDHRAQSDKPVNYTSIAIKGLLFHYKPTNATVTVDGKEYRFKKVWLAPTMNGRFYGGGMMPTPDQDRFGEDKQLSLMVFHGTGKIRTLMIFPSLFKGEHTKYAKNVTILTGKSITVKYDKPRDLQIDGETVRRVTEYTATAPATVTV